MFYIWLDFVKLGGEDYSDNSPISSTDELAVQYQYKTS